MKKSARRPKKRLKKKLSPIPRKLQMMVVDDVERYLDIIGMNHYRTKTVFMKHDESDEPHCCGKGTVAAAATVGLRYLTVTVKVYPYLVNQWKNKGMTDEDVHEVIAHEMAHVATNHLFTLAVSVYKDEGETKDAWESLTTIVGRMVHELDKRRRGFKRDSE